jgi:hypothetical protein
MKEKKIIGMGRLMVRRLFAILSTPLSIRFTNPPILICPLI